MVHSRHAADRILPGAPALQAWDLGRAGALTLLRVSAGLVWPVASPAIPQGALLIDDRGRIVAVGTEQQVPRPPGTRMLRADDAVVLPGLVNAHTHLELTGLRGQLDQTEFFGWIQQVRRAKDAAGPEDFHAWALGGVQEAWRHGTTTVGDTGTSGAVAAALTQVGGSGVVYQEAIGPDPAQARAAFSAVASQIDRLRGGTGPRVTVGISPHAPYTVSAGLYRLVAEYARTEHLPMATHIAESPAEVAFVRDDEGPFAQAWRTRKIPHEVQARSPVALLDRLGVLGPGLLAIHAVQTDAADVALLREAGCAAVLCPRSNRRHGHGEPPARRYVEAGLPLAVGTDSVASVSSLDLWAEARAARSLAAVSAEATLSLITLDGARALGLEGTVGTLETGKWADLCVMRPASLPVHDPAGAAEAILEAGADAILATFVSGRLVYGSLEQRTPSLTGV